MTSYARRRTISVILLFVGIAISAAAIWMLVDVRTLPLLPGLTIGPGNSPRVGIAAGILAVVTGIVCCFALERQKNFGLVVLLILLALTIASFGVAVKDRLDIKNAEDLLSTHLNKEFNKFSRKHDNQFGRQPSRGNIDFTISPFETKEFENFKTQLLVMAIVTGISAILEIISMILAATLRPESSSRNAMQMERSY